MNKKKRPKGPFDAVIDELQRELKRTDIEVDEWLIEASQYGETDADKVDEALVEVTLTLGGASVKAEQEQLLEALRGVSDGARLGFEFFTGLFGGEVQADAPEDDEEAANGTDDEDDGDDDDDESDGESADEDSPQH